MSFKFRPQGTRVSCILLLISLAIPGRAAVIEKQVVIGSPHRGRVVRVATHYAEADVNLLQRAYHLLERADHDYNGNRKRAMKEIEAAAREMGVNVRGDGRGDENQRTSDDQLAGARSLLEEVRGKLTNKEAKHVARAIEHLNTALKIR